jgi:phosphopantetheinyl transferase
MRSESRASLAGIALALRALAHLLGRTVQAGEIVFAQGEKPRLASLAAHHALAAGEAPPARERATQWTEGTTVDFSISHSGPWVACAALSRGCVGLDLEMGTDRRIVDWVLREAALKASGEGLRALERVGHLTVHEGRLHWRGGVWHVLRLEGFEGASACVVCNLELAEVETHAIALAELFDP